MPDLLDEAAADWATGKAGQRRLKALRAVCDTFVPAVDRPKAAPPDPFWGRVASDLGVERAVAGYIASRLGAADRTGLEQFLDLLARSGFSRLPLAARTRMLKSLHRAHPDLTRGLDALRALTMLFFYARPDETGTNPNWPTVGYPGPPQVTRATERDVRPLTLRPGTTDVTLTTDVCVIGSGSGGGVVAAELTAAGNDVLVLEAGDHYEAPDFPAYELDAYRDLYWRDGLAPTADGTVTVIAGATLGGGSTVNWMNCVRPPDWVREQWRREHGLAGLDGADFDAHLAAVSERIGVTAACSEPNGPNSRLAEGAEAFGWSHRVAERNTDPATYDPASAGHVGFGDVTGSKQSTTRTFLADADRAGARVVVGCRAQRVIVQEGRAAGVQALLSDGRTLTVRAPVVVVAAGALETPALLLRSGIGGPAVGRNLHLHPVPAMGGFYREEQRAWWGAPQTVIVDEFADLDDGYGFLVECPHFGTGLFTASVPWRSGRDHKVLSARSAHLSPFIAVVRDRGSGQVTVDDDGQAVVRYPLDDPFDLEHLRAALGALTRLHAAAGAHAIIDLAPKASLWRTGGDLDGFISRIQAEPFGLGRRSLFSAHQMGTARMGTDRATSVADPEGQLHDTPGVWVGDTSAFPTASGANPMLTCMALARRTAHALLAAS